MSALATALLAALLGLAACAGEPGRAMTPSAPEPDVAAEAEPVLAPLVRKREGTISRAELDGWLDGGPPRMLIGIEVHAATSVTTGGKHFDGWVIDKFWPGDARFAAVDLLPGDVVHAVNGQKLIRPEHLQTVWDGLRDATTLVVDVTRGRESFQLKYDIVSP